MKMPNGTWIMGHGSFEIEQDTPLGSQRALKTPTLILLVDSPFGAGADLPAAPDFLCGNPSELFAR